MPYVNVELFGVYNENNKTYTYMLPTRTALTNCSAYTKRESKREREREKEIERERI